MRNENKLDLNNVKTVSVEFGDRKLNADLNQNDQISIKKGIIFKIGCQKRMLELELVT